MYVDWIYLGMDPVEVSCAHGNESFGSIKCGEFLHQLNTCWLLKKGSVWICRRLSFNIKAVYSKQHQYTF
jgi:hypothetical protein